MSDAPRFPERPLLQMQAARQGVHERDLLRWPPFRRWMDRLRAGHERGDWRVDGVVARDVVLFGPADEPERLRIGMVLAEARGRNRDGSALNGVAFLRGDSVAILPVLRDGAGREWTVVTEQPRVAAGDPAFREIPAGMLDGEGVRSKALDELREEVGPDFDVRPEELVELGSVHPSPGGCDEVVQIVAFERGVDDDVLDSLRGRETGLRGEGEGIRLRVVRLNELPEACPTDMKARLALELWRAHDFARTMEMAAPPREDPGRAGNVHPFPAR